MVSTNCAQCASSQACWLAPHEESGRSLNVHLKSPRVGCRRKTNRHSASFVFLQCGAASSPDFSPACDYPQRSPSPSGSTSVQISRNGGSCPSPSGRRWPEGPDEGAFPALTRRFAPPSPKGGGAVPEQVSNLTRHAGGLCRRTHDQLLHAPVGGFRGVHLRFRRARELVDPRELLELAS